MTSTDLSNNKTHSNYRYKLFSTLKEVSLYDIHFIGMCVENVPTFTNQLVFINTSWVH